MSYDLSVKDSSRLVKKQKLGDVQKVTLKSILPKKHNVSSYILADISGSMHGEKMDSLKKALHDVWRPGIHGIAFESSVYDFYEDDIDELSARASTNMLDALKAAWSDSADHIVLLTDGQPDQDESEILKHVRNNSHTPIDTIGIGSSRYSYNVDFLKEISNITGGRFNSVNEPLLLSQVMTKLLQIEASTSGNCSNSSTIAL